MGVTETGEDAEAYAEVLPIVELCGDGARTRLLASFATEPDREFSVAELARNAELSRGAMYDHLDGLGDRQRDARHPHADCRGRLRNGRYAPHAGSRGDS